MEKSLLLTNQWLTEPENIAYKIIKFINMI
jgi:hypothetical protein